MKSERKPLSGHQRSWASPGSIAPDGEPSAALPRSDGPDAIGRPAEPRGANDVLSPADITLIDSAYRFIISDSRCTLCGRSLTGAFEIRLHDPHAPHGSWIATVSSRCKGWRRHRNDATVWVSNDGLQLRPFRAGMA